MTNVPQVTVASTGLVVPAESAILAGVTQDLNAAFGGNLNPDPTTPQGQLAVSQAAIIGNADDTFLALANQFDPAFASGRWQDALARIYFLKRNPAQPTSINVLCVGAPNLVIGQGSLIQDQNGNTYTNVLPGTISPAGSVVIQFINTVPGPIPVPQPNTVSIFSAVMGWDGVTVQSGSVGVNVESRAAFELRRQATVAANSVGMLSSVRGAVLQVPGVTDAYVTENTSSSPTTIGGVSLVPNSVYVCVAGSASGTLVAQAIWSKKIPGCSYNGNVTVVVQDTNSGYTAPFPSYNVTYQSAQFIPIFFNINIVASNLVPANAATLIQNAVIAAFAGLDGGPRASIGGLILATRYGGPNGPIGSLGSWAQIRSINLGAPNNPTASIVGSISGSTLTVTSVLSGGPLAAGELLTTGSTSTGSATVLPGTSIVSQSSGSVGGTGVYVVTNSQLVLSGTLTLSTVNLSAIQMAINQSPQIFAPNISVSVT